MERDAVAAVRFAQRAVDFVDLAARLGQRHLRARQRRQRLVVLAAPELQRRTRAKAEWRHSVSADVRAPAAPPACR